MQEIIDIIKKSKKINIYTHRGPDGDSLGATVGLKRILEDNYPHLDIKAIVLDPLAGKLATCDIAKETTNQDRQADLYVYPDTPIINLATSVHQPSIAIDHHSSHVPFTDKQFVKVGPSCCGLFLREFEKIKLNISSSAAEALMVGAVTDTGQGVYGDLAARTQALKDIMDLDAICGKYQRSYVTTFWGLNLDQEKWLGKMYPLIDLKDKCMTLAVPEQDSKGASLSDLRMTLQELTHRIPAEHYIWGYHYNGTIRYSMRSETKDVSKFAKRFGGAGHRGAAPFECNPDKLSPEKIFEDFRKYVAENKE